MKTQIKATYRTVRLPNSRSGNPRYKLETLEGEAIGMTRVDSSIAYGEVPNNSERGECLIKLSTTNRGTVYVESVEKIQA